MPVSSDTLPPHLESLVPSEWGIWRWFVLRGAGFQAELIKRLAQPKCAAQADALIFAGDHLHGLFQNAIRSLNGMMDELRRKGEDRYGTSFKSVLNARRRLADGKLPRPEDFSPEIGQMFHEIAEAMQERARLEAEWSVGFNHCLISQTEALREFAVDPMLQEAVVWQNRRAYEITVKPAGSDHGNSNRSKRERNHEQLIANYAQRYCLKNDTIGFFGPVAWGRIEPGPPTLELRCGPSLIKRRQTYFENWAIDKVALSLSLLEDMDWWIPPRLVPDVFIERGTLQRPGTAPTPLSVLEEAVLSRCDGKRLPEDILREIQADPRFHGCGQQKLRDVLEAKVDEGIMVWRFLVPVEVNAEIGLRQQLLQIGDAALRAAAMRCLDKLEAARREVADAAGDPVQLNEAMRKLEIAFEEITNAPANRNAGNTYGGRAVVYEDCQRDMAIRIAPDLFKPIVPALSLLLKSLRWFMQSTALEFQRLFNQTYRELAAARARRNVPLQDWWSYTEPKLLSAPSIGEVEKLFRQKWDHILPIEGQNAELQLESANLKQKVEQLFPDLGAGYYPVRYFCPDLMVAARDAEAIRCGDALFVLGEVHAGKNTLCHAALVEQHPERNDLVEATQWDLSASCLKILSTQADTTTNVRTNEGVLRPADYLLATTLDAVAPTGYVCHPISELMVREDGDELQVLSREDGRHFHILEAFSDLLFAFVMNKASWISPLPHVPRVLIDTLVIHREAWRFGQDELDFAMEKDESRRFIGARRWMKRHGLPPEMFVKSALEVKPFYLSLDSPVLVEILCRAIRRMTSSGAAGEGMVFSEMLPGVQQLWLKDAAGASYTSELRFAVVDLKARSWSAAAQH